MNFPTTKWLPDVFDPVNPGLTLARNAIPHTHGFLPMPSYVANAPALSGRAVGATWGRQRDADPVNIAGTETGLFMKVPTGWDDVTPAGAQWAGIPSWDFTQFGRYIIATSEEYAPYKMDLEADDPIFVPLEGSPPVAKYIASIRDFVVLGNIENFPFRVQWSGFNNETIWTSNIATQSDYNDLSAANGNVQQIVPGQYGLIFQENAISRMDYVGPPVIFRFDEFEEYRGTDAPHSVCWTEGKTFFYGRDGFYQIDKGQRFRPIGTDQVDRWVETSVRDVFSISGVVNPRMNTVFWSLRLNTQDYYDTILIYRFDIRTWSFVSFDHELLSLFVAEGETLDADSFNTIYGDVLDGANQIPFDSALWEGGRITLHVFDVDHIRGAFQGSSMPATFRTGFVPLVPNGQRFFLSAVRPIVDRITAGGAGDIMVRVDVKNETNQSIADNTQEKGLNRNGEAPLRLSGRYARLSVEIDGGFDGFSGFRLSVREMGRQ